MHVLLDLTKEPISAIGGDDGTDLTRINESCGRPKELVWIGNRRFAMRSHRGVNQLQMAWEMWIKRQMMSPQRTYALLPEETSDLALKSCFPETVSLNEEREARG